MVFAQGNPELIAQELQSAEVVIGEPDPKLAVEKVNLIMTVTVQRNTVKNCHR